MTMMNCYVGKHRMESDLQRIGCQLAMSFEVNPVYLLKVNDYIYCAFDLSSGFLYCETCVTIKIYFFAQNLIETS